MAIITAARSLGIPQITTHNPSIRTPLNTGRPIETTAKHIAVQDYWTNTDEAKTSPIDRTILNLNGPPRLATAIDVDLTADPPTPGSVDGWELTSTDLRIHDGSADVVGYAAALVDPLGEPGLLNGVHDDE